VSVAVRAPAKSANTGAAPRAGAATTPPAVAFDHEEIVVRHGERSGCCVIVAIHSTALGPALGGVRLWHYPATTDAVADALRLARGMTMKAAAAGLDLGGGKGVIHAPGSRPPSGSERTEMLLDFGDLVESLDGRYITAEDVGISPRDMVEIGRRTRHLTGLPTDRGGSGDPSPLTAIGVEAAMRACVRDRFGARGLDGLRIGVVGLGHVGTSLARLLLEAGAGVVASDIAPGKRALAGRLGLDWVEPGEAMTGEYDVLAPCALGGGLDAATVEELRCAIVCGAANNQLASDGLAERLAEREILYAPDYVVNAGGLMHVYREIRGYDEDEATGLALAIEMTVERMLESARRDATTPLAAAGKLAAERLGMAGEVAQVPH
jgi:leucine dehydrogenase